MNFDRLLAYLIFSGFVILLALAIIERSKCLLITLAEKRRTEESGRDAAALYARLQRERDAFESAKQESAFALETIAREKAMGFPWLANAYSEYQALIDLKIADALEDKERPAPRAAEQNSSESSPRKKRCFSGKTESYGLCIDTMRTSSLG